MPSFLGSQDFQFCRVKMAPEERYGFKKDYTNFVGRNIRKINKRIPIFIFLSSIIIFKSTPCYRDVKGLICNSFSCFDCAVVETERKLTHLKPIFMSVTITAKTPLRATRGKTIPCQINALMTVWLIFLIHLCFSPHPHRS